MSSQAPAAGERSLRSKWVRRLLVWPIVALVVLLGVGSVYQAIASANDRRSHPEPGRMVDVGGHKLHINCTGEGSPAVILESGNGGFSSHWVRVQQQLSRTTKVCSYDRAGAGWSEAGMGTRDANTIAGELHTLLATADVEGPFVLVGHSFGGFYVRAYAARYPDEVVGMVLVDSSHPDQFASPEGKAEFKQVSRLIAIAPWATRLGIMRLANIVPADPDLPAEQRAQVQVFNNSNQHVGSSSAEFRATGSTTEQVRGAPDLGSLPLAVVTAGEQDAVWQELQNDLAALSTNSRHRVVEGATHGSLIYKPSDVQLTSSEIERVVQAVRSGQPLSSAEESQ